MAPDPADRLILLDWYKHLTTLSLIIMGGIAGFVPQPLPIYAIAALGLQVLGGATAFGACRNLLPGAPANRERQLHAARWAAPAAISIGAGVFVGGYVMANVPT